MFVMQFFFLFFLIKVYIIIFIENFFFSLLWFRLISEMQKAYVSFDSRVEECCIGKSYAVFCESKKQWFRGTILSKIDAEKVKVGCNFFLCLCWVSVLSVFILGKNEIYFCKRKHLSLVTNCYCSCAISNRMLFKLSSMSLAAKTLNSKLKTK